jgi:hypothetical protein
MDRELHHINPKGRPVKQCEHCRGARKSKSHHAKCDCGDKKDKDKHKDKGDAKGEPLDSVGVDGVSNHAAVNGSRCACHSGAKCICGVKKDSIDLKLDTSKLTLHAARAKPTLKATQSESTLTVFANGHHKPCHRHNLTAHVSGAPYKLGRPHTLHGSAAFASYTQSHSTGKPEGAAQRAVDTQSLSNNDYYAMFGSNQRPLDGLPLTPLTGSLDPTCFQDSLFGSRCTAYGTDANSPTETQTADTFSAPQWPWTSTTPSVNPNYPYGSLSTSPSQDCLPNYESEWAIPSAGLNNPLWSAGDLPLDPSKLNDSVAQPISHSGESNKQSSAGLTTASSSHSEVGEPALFGDLDLSKTAPSVTDKNLFWDDNPPFRFPVSQSHPTLAPTLTPPYVETAPSTKDIMTIPSTNPSDKGALFPTTDFNDLCAIAMPSDANDTQFNWNMNQANIYDGPDLFDLSYTQSWI